MSITVKKIQFHKSNDTDELWMPLTQSGCIKLIDFVTDSTLSGDISSEDTLNDALNKLQNSAGGGSISGGTITGNLVVDGNIAATGNITSNANISDIKLKTNIKPFKGIDILNKMDFVQFNWNEQAVNVSKSLNTSSTNYGVVAQNTEGVIDDFVFDLSDDYKGVRYEKLIPIMAQAIKELKSEIDALKQTTKQK